MNKKTGDILIIENAIQAVSAEVSTYPHDEALKSVLIQLQYVKGVLENTEKDIGRVSRLSIGVTAVKLLGDEFPHLVDLLLDADAVAKGLREGVGMFERG